MNAHQSKCASLAKRWIRNVEAVLAEMLNGFPFGKTQISTETSISEIRGKSRGN